MPKPQYKQKFRGEWLNDPALKNWLIVKKRGSGVSVPQCNLCQCILTPKLSDLKAHALTKKHKASAGLLTDIAKQTSLPFTTVEKIDDTKLAEGRIAVFVAAHTSVATCDHISCLCKSIFSDSNIASRIQLKRSKCSAIIKNVLYPQFVQDLKDSIGNKYYSLLIDESTDISVMKYLGVAVIYHDELSEKIVSTFLSLSEIEDCTADGIVATIKHTLGYFGLDINKLRGIGTDNASVMVGVNAGVYKKLKVDVPNLVLIRCVCHSLQLSVSAAAAECLPRNLE